MKKYLKILLVIALISIGTNYAHATILPVPQGGTGVNSVVANGFLYNTSASTGPLTSDANATRVPGTLTNISDSFSSGDTSAIQLNPNFLGASLAGVGLTQTAADGKAVVFSGDGTSTGQSDFSNTLYSMDNSGSQGIVVVDGKTGTGTVSAQYQDGPISAVVGLNDGGSTVTYGNGSLVSGIAALPGQVLRLINGTVWNWPTTDGTTGQVLTTDGSGNLSFQTAGGGGTIYPANQVVFGDGSTPGGITDPNFLFQNGTEPTFQVGDLLQAGNQTSLTLSDSNNEIDFGGEREVHASNPAFTGSGLNDLSVNNSPVGNLGDSYTVEVQTLDSHMYNASITGIAGGTFTDTTSGATATFQVYDFVNGHLLLDDSTIVGTISNGDNYTLSSGGHGTINADMGVSDTFSWTGPTIFLQYQQMSNPPTFPVNNIQISFGNSLGHTVFNFWTWSYVYQYGRMAMFNGAGDIDLGDVDQVGKGTQLLVQDQSQFIGAKTQAFQIEDPSSSIGYFDAQFDNGNPDILIGPQGAGNGTTLDINDGNSGMTGQFNGTTTFQDTSGHETFEVNNQDGEFQLGDINQFNNGANLDIQAKGLQTISAYAQEFNAGDLRNTGNSTKFSIDDSNSNIVFQAENGLQAIDNGGNNWFNFNPSVGTFQYGLFNGGSYTNLVMSDSDQTLTFHSGGSPGGDIMELTGGSGTSVVLGDIGSLVGKTVFNLNDTNRTITDQADGGTIFQDTSGNLWGNISTDNSEIGDEDGVSQGIKIDVAQSTGISFASNSATYIFPQVQGSAGQVMENDGSGNLTWQTPSSGTPGGSNTDIQYNNSGAFGGDANFSWQPSINTFSAENGSGDLFQFAGTGEAINTTLANGWNWNGTGGGTINFNVPSSTFTNYSLIWPDAQGGSGTVLTNDGSGNLSWTAGGLTIGSPISGGTAQEVLYVDNSGNLFSDADFTRDSSNENTNISGTDGNQTSSISVGAFGNSFSYNNISSGNSSNANINNSIAGYSFSNGTATNSFKVDSTGGVFGNTSGGNGTQILINDSTGSITETGSISFNAMQAYTSGGSVTISNGERGIYYDPATTQATATITLPSTPTDGQELLVSFGGTITSGTVVTILTIAPNSGQTILGTLPTTATINTVIEYKWRAATSQWYEID